jgi:predicted PhzF superfamily epimerase YddE/YHI9
MGHGYEMNIPTSLQVTQIDAFTDTPFTGNPAAVVVLDQVADARWMQAVAAEVNLSETAFLVPLGAADGSHWGLRWFTPTVEVDLCGHATLASAFHLFGHLPIADGELRFDTRSGWLSARRLADGWIELDFPGDPVLPVDAPPGLLDALGLVEAVAVSRGRFDLVVEVSDATIVRSLDPDHRSLRSLPVRGISVSAPGDEGFAVVSRFFAPGAGVDEDPVTGSAHCTLGPYWGARLGLTDLRCYQASPRGGVVRVRSSDDGSPPWRQRVLLAGQAVAALDRR